VPPTRARRGLDPRSQEHLTGFYRRALARFGPGHSMAVWWNSARSQGRRFEVLAEAGPWQGASVADVGCGLGDLFGFLESRGLGVRYQGYDLSPEMVAAARAKHPHPRARFELCDVVAAGLPRRFDYVVASGTFNVRVRNHERYLRQALEVMYAGCRRAAALNVLTPIPPDHPDAELIEKLYGDLFYYVPLDTVLRWCGRVTPRVEARTGYHEWDATVFLHR
jgi:SAM-dependent methyltransferase